MVVGEAPGRSEDDGGEPFIGRSGQLLVRLIEDEVGLTRSEYFITNVVKCRPPANRTPQRIEIESCRAWLEEQLRVVAPRVVLALGNTAARAVFGLRDGITQSHGLEQHLGAARGLATYHPAAALRGGASVVELMREDLRALRTMLAGP